MTDSLTKLAFQTFQQGKNYLAIAHKMMSGQIREWVAPRVEQKTQSLSPQALQKFQKRVDKILQRDWQDAEAGVYSTDLLFDGATETFWQYPLLCWELPQVWEKANRGSYREFSPDIDTRGYPNYYLQNFHYQIDGYLSDRSAELYDLQVEILFNGLGDTMRRRILAPLKQEIEPLAANLRTPRDLRILDVACGTGRMLKGLRSTFPQASLFGVDLSPAYLRKANQLLSSQPGELPQLLQGNAEALPYRDGYFHAVTCVFLFHELPAPVRQNVFNEMFRVLQPGGVAVICDSIQVEDDPDLKPAMENFQTLFHEPYYRDYIQDDLPAKLQTAGFVDVSTYSYFMSKYWVARKEPATTTAAIA